MALVGTEATLLGPAGPKALSVTPQVNLLNTKGCILAIHAFLSNEARPRLRRPYKKFLMCRGRVRLAAA